VFLRCFVHIFGVQGACFTTFYNPLRLLDILGLAGLYSLAGP
jgi:hypothetical protein